MNDNDLIREARGEAEKALRTPDLEWARDLVYGLARQVLALADALKAANERVAWLEKALREIASFDVSSDPDAVTCSIIAHDALANVPDEPEEAEQ